MERYDINSLALMTGFTTRTIRNYISMGLLNGEKINGAWSFSEEDVESFMNDEGVKKALTSKTNAIVHDFLADGFKKQNRICMVLDLPVSNAESQSVMEFFGAYITEYGHDIRFKAVNERNLLRVILSGAEEQVLDIIKKYYNL